MILSIKHKFIFIHIPKTGGESITQKLRWHTTKKRRHEDLQDFIYWGESDDIDLAHIYQDILSKYVPQDMITKYYKFCIVRNPYNRCYSAYKDLFLGATNKHAVKSSYGVWIGKYNKPSSLSEYCKMLNTVSSNTPSRFNIHVIPQYMYIYDKSKKRMDYIGHYETMDKDMKHIYEKFNIKEDVWFDNISTYNVKVDNLKKSYMKELSSQDIHEINRAYFADFILFDYPIVIPSKKRKNTTTKTTNTTKTQNNDLSSNVSTTYKKKLITHFTKLLLARMKNKKTKANQSISSSSSTMIININGDKITINHNTKPNSNTKLDKLIETGIKEVLDCSNLSVDTIVLDKKMLSKDPKEVFMYIYYTFLYN